MRGDRPLAHAEPLRDLLAVRPSAATVRTSAPTRAGSRCCGGVSIPPRSGRPAAAGGDHHLLVGCAPIAARNSGSSTFLSTKPSAPTNSARDDVGIGVRPEAEDRVLGTGPGARGSTSRSPARRRGPSRRGRRRASVGSRRARPAPRRRWMPARGSRGRGRVDRRHEPRADDRERDRSRRRRASARDRPASSGAGPSAFGTDVSLIASSSRRDAATPHYRRGRGRGYSSTSPSVAAGDTARARAPSFR